MTKLPEDEITAEQVLSFRSYYKEYKIDELDAVFADIAEFVNLDKIKPKDFHSVALSCGSHSPKYVNSRSKVGGLYFQSKNRNLPPKSYSSGNAGMALYAKILLRPIKIEGLGGDDNFLDRIAFGGEVAERLKVSFSSAFGDEALEAVENALEDRKTLPDSSSIHHENMPVVYIPGPDETDLLTTPIPCLEGMNSIEQIQFAAWKDFAGKRAEATKTGIDLKVTPGRWVKTMISAKVWNHALNLNTGGSRFRFFSEMPEVISRRESDFLAMKANSDWFPRFYEPEVAGALLKYAERLELNKKPEAYVNRNISAGTDRLADFIVRSAVSFVDEIMSEFAEQSPEADRSPPDLVDVLKTLPVHKKDRVFAMEALHSAHFESRLKKAGLKS